MEGHWGNPQSLRTHSAPPYATTEQRSSTELTTLPAPCFSSSPTEFLPAGHPGGSLPLHTQG